MIVRVNRAKCSGHARCNAVAPDVYSLNSNGFSSITELVVPVHLEDAARRGAANCPERAIEILGDDGLGDSIEVR